MAIADEARPRFAELFVDTPDGTRLYVRVLGTGPDTVIIGSVAYLSADFTPLAAGRTLIFYDPRNRGGSDRVLDADRVSMSHEVADLEAVRAHFGVARPALIGWSYLGAVVALYAAEYPENVRALVQVGPVPPRPATRATTEQRGSPPDSADLRVLAELQASDLSSTDPTRYCREVVLRQMVRPMMGRPEAADRMQADPCVYWNEWPNHVFATMRRFIPWMMGVEWNYSDRAAQVTAPVLIVHGTADPNAVVEGGRDWAALLPGAELVELPGVGHAPWLEAPTEFFSAVDRFLRAH
jgi:proline iminopeptidase